MWMPPRWWRSMYWQNRMSTSLPVAALSLAISSRVAMPGMRLLTQRALPVGHPGHRRLGAVGVQAPVLEPGLHHADLALLGDRDVAAERADLGQGRLLVRDHAHLDRLRVVGGHVPGEAGVGRVVAGRAGPRGRAAAQPANPIEQRRAARRASGAGRRRRARGGRETDHAREQARTAVSGRSEPGRAASGPVSVMPPLQPACGSWVAFCRSALMKSSIAAVVGVVDLELVAPGLQRDRRVQARVRAHQHERDWSRTLLGQLVDLVLGQVGPVGDPDRAVLHAVDRLLLGDLRRCRRRPCSSASVGLWMPPTGGLVG